MIELGELLEIGAHGVTAILATWLGLLVLTRAPTARGSRVFGFLCGLLVLWSVAIVVQRTTGSAHVQPPVNLVEDVAAWLLPAGTLHIALVIAFEGRAGTTARAVLVAGYLIAIVGIIQAIIDPGNPIAFDEPNFEPWGVDGNSVAWAFAGLRAAVFAFAIWELARALGDAGVDRVRRRQLAVALATVVLGVVGGMARILPEEIGGPRWVGVSLVALAVVSAAYAVVAQHLFLAAEVAGRAVRWSLAVGIGVIGYVTLILVLDATAVRYLDVDVPIVTALALVVTIALFDPLAVRVREWIAARSGDTSANLLLALGADPLLNQAPERAVVPTLERITRTFDLAGAAMTDAQGRVVASIGRVPPDAARELRLPLGSASRRGGEVVFVPRSDTTFGRAELGALRLAADFLRSSLDLSERQETQAAALASLRAERAVVESRGSALQSVLADAADADRGLHVFALGPLRAERDGQRLLRWGGEKAGSRQAEAIFAMLFDRGDRGASKDEILEVIWPDVDLERADVAFHRTMLGLRSTLRPAGRARHGEAIVFHNDRYHLDAAVVAWSDVAEFERLLRAASSVGSDEAIEHLEQARSLYRGEYLDDVPYLGDSVLVEDRRDQLREALRDLLVELAKRYDARGDTLAAAACQRQAASVAGDAFGPSSVASAQ